MIKKLLTTFFLFSLAINISAQSVSLSFESPEISLSGFDSANVLIKITPVNFNNQLFLSLVSSDLPAGSKVLFPYPQVNYPYSNASIQIITPDGIAKGIYKVKIKAANGPVEALGDISVNYNPSSCQWQTFMADVPGEFSSFMAVVIDSNNIKWFGTGYGIVKFDGNSWTKYSLGFFNHSRGDVLDIEVDLNNHIWFVSSDGLTWFNGSSYKTYNYKNSQMPDSHLMSLEIGTDGKVYIGTSNGLVVFDGTFWTIFNTSNSTIPFNLIKKVKRDRNGNIWVSSGYGLGKFDGVNWTTYNPSDLCSWTMDINDFGFDKEGNIWLGLERGGLVRKSATEVELWTEDQHVVKRISDCSVISQSNNSILKLNSVKSLQFTSDGDLWVSGSSFSNGSIWRYSNGNSKMFSSDNSPIPQQANGYVLISEKNGKIWTYTGKNQNSQGPFVHSLICDNDVVTNVEYRRNNLFNLFPNPTNGLISISGKFTEKDFQVIVSDVLGKSFNDITAVFVNGNELQLDLHSLQSGLYFILIKNNDNTNVIEFIKN